MAMAPSSLSPLLSLGGALAARHFMLYVLLGLPVALLALFRGRWFCLHLCPTGLVMEQAGKLNAPARKRFLRWPHLGHTLAIICLGGAVVGYPLFLWLDPLALFTGFISVWKVPVSLVTVLPAAGFVLVLLLSLLAPHAWCHRLCPLGATQDWLALAGRKLLGHPHPAPQDFPAHHSPVMARRTFLFALAGGVGGYAARRALGRSPALPVRPPGAVPEAELTALCARCGNCIRACPSQIIQPDLGRSGIVGLMTPVVVYEGQYCDEWCNECDKVCPTGALAHLTLDEKRATAIGNARIDRTRCIAWAEGKYCMVCQEFCPYLAIELVDHNGVNCPVVDSELCRGCGACQSNCPAITQKAIVVSGIPQRSARPMPE